MSQYYVLSGETALAMMLELKNIRELSAYFLKFEIDKKDTCDWEGTVIPDLAELYAGSRACIQMMQDIMEQEPPPEYKSKITGGGLCITGEQYEILSSVYSSVKVLKGTVVSRSNFSFEVH